MLKKFLTVLLVYSFVSALFFSCKTGEDSKRNDFKGKWDLILWDNRRMDGTFVFTDSLAYFNLNYLTDISKYKIDKDTMRFIRVGGSMTYLSGSEYWIIEQSDTLTFKLISSNGNITTAYKSKYFKDFDGSQRRKDPNAVEL